MESVISAYSLRRSFLSIEGHKMEETLNEAGLLEPQAMLVKRRIMRFMRQMHVETDEPALVKAAIDRAWLDAGGAPTAAGQRLVRAFDDLDRFSASY